MTLGERMGGWVSGWMGGRFFKGIAFRSVLAVLFCLADKAMQTPCHYLLPNDPMTQPFTNHLPPLLIAPRRRFVEDNWESPVLGAWGLGWEVWLDGMEVTQFTYFQQVRHSGVSLLQ